MKKILKPAITCFFLCLWISLGSNIAHACDLSPSDEQAISTSEQAISTNEQAISANEQDNANLINIDSASNNPADHEESQSNSLTEQSDVLDLQQTDGNFSESALNDGENESNCTDLSTGQTEFGSAPSTEQSELNVNQPDSSAEQSELNTGQPDSSAEQSELSNEQTDLTAGGATSTGTHICDYGGSNDLALSVHSEDIIITNLNSTVVAQGKVYPYYTFSYTFQKAGEETTYDTLITGIYLTPVNGIPGTPSTLVGKLTLLAQDIAAHFLSGVRYDLLNNGTSVTKNPMMARYGLYINPIDTEKKTTTTIGNPDDYGYPLYDAYQCWAATASNMLEYTGWARAAGYDNDTAMDYYMNQFYDSTGTITNGLKWFFNGINPGQQVNADGTIQYCSGTKSPANQRNSGSGYKLANYPAETCVNSYDLKNAQDRGDLQNIITTLKNHGAVGLQAYYYLNGKQITGHALTCLGYIKENGVKEGDGIRALFLTDSDSDCVNNLSVNRANVYNRMTLYELADSEEGYREIVNYLTGFSGIQTLIQNYVTLMPYKSSMRETEGTRNPYSNVDLVIDSLYPVNLAGEKLLSAHVDEAVYILLKVKNLSYAILNNKQTAGISFEITIQDSAAQIVTFTGSFLVVEQAGSFTAFLPLAVINCRLNDLYTIQSEGPITFTARITGLTDENGTPISEAYYLNNDLMTPFVLMGLKKIVPDVPVTPDDPKEDPVPTERSYQLIKLSASSSAPQTGDSNGSTMNFLLLVLLMSSFFAIGTFYQLRKTCPRL